MSLKNLIKKIFYQYFKKDSHYYYNINNNKINFREFIGDQWNEIGELQFSFLKSKGLKPHHKLIDIGCGSLRGGVHYIKYLDEFNYFGTDINQNLINYGLEKELNIELKKKIKLANFIVSKNFDFNFETKIFDYAIALSLFTHLRKNNIIQCLKNINKKIKNGIFYATFFVVDDKDKNFPFNQSKQITTYNYKDPFHYTLDEIKDMAVKSNFEYQLIDDFIHPRNQKMIAFFKKT